MTVEAVGVGRRYGRFWALRDLTLQLPAGSITAVVGPNGAGKTTLLNLLVGLPPPSEGELSVVGQRPGNDPGFLAKVGFVAQDCPLYTEFTAEDLLRFGRHLNPKWDDALARDRLDAANVPLRAAGRTAVGARRPRWRWLWPWPSVRTCSCSTNRSPAWTPLPGGSSCSR